MRQPHSALRLLVFCSGRSESVGWALSSKPKGHRFDSQPRPGLQVWSPVGAHARGNQSMFLSCINVSLSLFFSSLLLPLSLESIKEKRIFKKIVHFFLPIEYKIVKQTPWISYMKSSQNEGTRVVRSISISESQTHIYG